MNLSVYWWYNSKDDESPCGTRMGGNVGFDGELFDGEILLLTNDTSQADSLLNSESNRFLRQITEKFQLRN